MNTSAAIADMDEPAACVWNSGCVVGLVVVCFRMTFLEIIASRAGKAGRARDARKKSESHFLPVLSVSKGAHAE